MTKGFLTQLSLVIVFHLLVLMGTWQLSQTEYVQNNIAKMSVGVMKLQLASKIVGAGSVQKKSEPVVQKHIQKSDAPLVPVKKVESTVASAPATETASEGSSSAPTAGGAVRAGGSEFGTAIDGKTDVKSVYKAELRSRIEKNKFYPPMAKRLGQTGTVVVAFTLLEDGKITDVRIESPSAYAHLNTSALEAVKKVERFKPIPKEFGEARMDFKVPVKFKTI